MADIRGMEWLRKMSDEAKARTASKQAQELLLGEPKMVTQLVPRPVPSDKCAVPHFAVRSALFSASGKGMRQRLNGALVASQGGLSIVYTGEQLDQCDLDVWESVIHIGSRHRMGATFRVTGYQLLKHQGRAVCGSTRNWLYQSLVRLKATAIEIRWDGGRYVGSLVEEFIRDDKTGSYSMKLNPAMAEIFQHQQFTFLDRAIRQSLRRNPLAKWLHGYYASHAEPYPVKISTLHAWCGSQAKVLRHFKADLIKSMVILAEAYEQMGLAFSFSIEGDLVHVSKAKKLAKGARQTA